GPAITTTSTSAELIWHPLADIYNIIEYVIYLDGQVNKVVEPQEGMQKTKIDNLTTGDHTVTITATNNNREGPHSQPVTFAITTVPAPLEVQVYNKSADTVWLTWQPVPGASSYILSMNDQQIGQTYEPSYIKKSLNPDTTYEISVVTVMPDGQQSPNTYVTVQTDPLADTMSALSLSNKIFTYLHDVKIYIEILFAMLAAMLLAEILKVSLRGSKVRK
ncbi:MAG: fibronectin type III domain-containing protein, partial [Methanocorpusculum sp.]|nr:fibronectin type III domain-containing protein [Methanocorpusculum sp.]